VSFGVFFGTFIEIYAYIDMCIGVMEGDAVMELNLKFLVQPQAVGGFGPELHWSPLGLLPIEPTPAPTEAVGEVEGCC
jgi:hypothetical protein